MRLAFGMGILWHNCGASETMTIMPCQGAWSSARLKARSMIFYLSATWVGFHCSHLLSHSQDSTLHRSFIQFAFCKKRVSAFLTIHFQSSQTKLQTLLVTQMSAHHALFTPVLLSFQ